MTRTDSQIAFAARTIEKEGFRYTHTDRGEDGKRQRDHFLHANDLRTGLIIWSETGEVCVMTEEPEPIQ